MLFKFAVHIDKMDKVAVWGYNGDVFVWSGQVIWGSLSEIYHSNGNSGLPAPALLQHRSLSLSDETVCPCLETHCRHYRKRNQRASWYIRQSIIVKLKIDVDLYMLSWIQCIYKCWLVYFYNNYILSYETKVGCLNLSLRQGVTNNVWRCRVECWNDHWGDRCKECGEHPDTAWDGPRGGLQPQGRHRVSAQKL